MSELMLQDSQQITKSEDVIPPSLRARTTQDWVVRTARVALQDPTPSIRRPVHKKGLLCRVTWRAPGTESVLLFAETFRLHTKKTECLQNTK